MRWIVLALACGCTSPDPNATTITGQQLVGTWNGTASVGKTYRYAFGADGSYQWGQMKDGSFVPVSSGTYGILDKHTLQLDGAVPDEEGMQHHVIATTSAYATSDKLCVDALYAAEAYDSFVGDWSLTTTSVAVDVNDQPMGSLASSTMKLSFDGNGFVLQDIDGQELGGTYTKTGDQVTVTFQNGNVSSVRTFTVVDNAVACDPLYTK